MHFNTAWHEHTTLRDGRAIELRLLRPGDRERLIDGFARMSPQARYQRFHGVRDALTSADLRYLTELDGRSHFALVALDDQTRKGLGVARFVELAPDIAEPAITVVDEAQGQGLGRLLLERLTAAASERGIRHFRFEVLADNTPMIKLLHEVAPGAREHRDGIEVTIDVPVEARQTGLQRLLAAAARGLFVVLQRGAERPGPVKG